MFSNDLHYSFQLRFYADDVMYSDVAPVVSSVCLLATADGHHDIIQ